jgi:hypothetical protein
MTQDQFNELYRLIRKGWTKRTGIVVRLQRAEDDSSPLLLCVGCLSNPGFIAQNCKLWDGDDLLYDGPIMSDKIRQLLTDNNICHAEVSTAKRLDVSNGVFTCLGDKTTCDKSCTLRKAKKAQIGSVDVLIK